MPITSSEIAALAGGFNQQTMLGMQHSAMISNQFGGYAPSSATHPVPTQGENLTAGMMQFGANAAMGLLSRPGMNEGMMGGFSAAGRGVLGQMVYGVQQQQMLDASMRQAYRHQNQYGGAGFTPTQLGGMQRDMMSMSMQRGPTGEQVTFEELGRLASNMGRMGMSESIRSVKDFNEKFKEMLTTVKEVATQLGTSLEEAQKTMMSMRGSGVFGMGTQKMMLKGMTTGAFAGGQYMSMGELSGAALIGSQLSRSIGGRGVHGAMAGAETMTQIGVMRNMGIISEEDVYNVTGMSGAEGRMALAQQDMERDARFLRSTHGRYMLAAAMGKGGKLDVGSLQTMMSGGTAASDIYGRGRQNMGGRQGAYGFLNREGLLRGEALAAGGGNLSTSFYAMELQRRGIDVSGGDERGALALQRIGGMNREEAEYQIKKIRNLGRMQVFREEMAGEQQYLKDVETQERRASPEDLMKDIDMARQRVNNELRNFGADLYKSWSAQVDGAVKRMSGEYERRINRNLASTVRALERGGPGAQQAMLDLGIGGGSMREASFATARGMAAGTYGAPDAGREVDRMIYGRYSELKQAGVDFSQISTVGDLQRAREAITRTSMAFAGNGEGGLGGSFFSGAGKDYATNFNQALALRGVAGQGSEFLQNFGSMLRGIEGGDAISEAYGKLKTDEERARFYRGMMSASGNGDLYQDRYGGAGMMYGAGTSRFGSSEEANLVMGRELLSGLDYKGVAGVGAGRSSRALSSIFDRGSFLAGRTGSVGKLLGKLGGYTAGLEDQWGSGLTYGRAQGLASVPRAMVGQAGTVLDRATLGQFSGVIGRTGALLDEYTGGAQKDLANTLHGLFGQGGTAGDLSRLNEEFRSEESFKQFGSLVSGDDATRTTARTELEDKLKKLKSGGMKNPSDLLEGNRLRGLLALSDYMEYKNNNGREPPADWMSRLEDKYGINRGGGAGLIKSAGSGVGQTQNEQLAQVRTSLTESVRREAQNIEKEISGIKESDMSPAVKAATQRQRERVKQRMTAFSKAGANNIAAIGGDQELVERFRKEDVARRSGMSLEDIISQGREKMQLETTREEGAADVEVGTLGMGFRKAKQRGVGAERQYLAGQLGVGISWQEAGKLSTPEALSRRIMEESGLSSSEQFTGSRRREFEARIKDILGGTGSPVEKAEKLSSLRRDFSKDLTIAGQEKQDAKAKETDPSYRMLSTINDSIKGLKDKAIVSELQNMTTILARGFKLEGGVGGKS